ncbi:MAG: M48 family metalloprotease [Candidatus Omnitrophica bacterium]|nr:M48 family metalloprotease [Candidatus Omnitrophota bacterium]
MPYSFVKIEKDKSRVIACLHLLLILIYFIIFYVMTVLTRMLFAQIMTPHAALQPFPNAFPFKFLTIPECLIALGFAVFVAMFHWSIATRDVIERTLNILRARPLDRDDLSHQQFQNILNELSVATGGKDFKGYVVPSMSINAFSVSDFDHTPVIGVTEGLLKRLKRPQIETVAAHEAAHILKGDSLDTTMMISLFNLPLEVLRDMHEEAELALIIRLSWQFMFTAVLSFIMLFLAKTVGQLLSIPLSRSREFRADAIAVRLTRNPLSLAEGLYLASYYWHGAGIPGENLSPIFLVRPYYSSFKEEEGLLADIFSTHPPVRQRLNILLDMAHTNFDCFEESSFGNYKKTLNQMRAMQESQPLWMVRQNMEWTGPHTLEEIRAFDGMTPQVLVKRFGEVPILPAEADEELCGIFKNRESKPPNEIYCPKCYLILEPVLYEDCVISKCRGCAGALVNERDVAQMLNTPQTAFNENIVRMAKIIKEEKVTIKDKGERQLYSDYSLACPRCQDYQNKMSRRFYSAQYAVEIDQCPICKCLWFDKDELEVLQLLSKQEQSLTSP